jgi:hypothetical protein
MMDIKPDLDFPGSSTVHSGSGVGENSEQNGAPW